MNTLALVALLLAAPVAAARPHIVFLIAEPEYGTAETLPDFARRELAAFRTTIVGAHPSVPHRFAPLPATADLLFVSVRRRAPTTEELAFLRAHLDAGRPLVGVRTASHAFDVRKREDIPVGHAVWPDFDVAVLGGRYLGHHGNGDGTTVAVSPGADGHPILDGVRGFPLRSPGTLYRVLALQPSARELLRGSALIDGRVVEHPVAWTNQRGKSRVFYTSLGHAGDFQQPAFRRLLLNGVLWALAKR